MTTENETAVAPRLWTPEGFRDDEWRHVESLDCLADDARVILPLLAWSALDGETRRAIAHRLGVLLAPGDKLDSIESELSRIPLIALAFPAFSDGRSYSKAQLLRSRHGYHGIIRASGDVLIDQIPLMVRTGFTEFEVRNETALRRLEEGRLGALPVYYQPTAKTAAPGVGYSWRRRPAVG